MANESKGRVTSASRADDISVELSSRLARYVVVLTLLIGFGFTIFQIFQKAHEAQLLRSSNAPRHFGEALVILGIGMLVVGIGYHVVFMLGLRYERKQLKRDGLVHAESQFPASLTLIVALLLLVIGILAITSMLYAVGPFE